MHVSRTIPRKSAWESRVYSSRVRNSSTAPRKLATRLFPLCKNIRTWHPYHKLRTPAYTSALRRHPRTSQPTQPPTHIGERLWGACVSHRRGRLWTGRAGPRPPPTAGLKHTETPNTVHPGTPTSQHSLPDIIRFHPTITTHKTSSIAVVAKSHQKPVGELDNSLSLSLHHSSPHLYLYIPSIINQNSREFDQFFLLEHSPHTPLFKITSIFRRLFGSSQPTMVSAATKQKVQGIIDSNPVGMLPSLHLHLSLSTSCFITAFDHFGGHSHRQRCLPEDNVQPCSVNHTAPTVGPQRKPSPASAQSSMSLSSTRLVCASLIISLQCPSSLPPLPSASENKILCN